MNIGKDKPKSVYGLFNDSFPPVLDGVTIAVENYCRWLIEAGEEVCVVTPYAPKAPVHDPRLRVERYFSLPIYNRHPYRYGYPLLDPFIWHAIRRTPFKIVHAHCPFSSGKLAAYAARHHDVPLVATFHSKYRTDLERSLPRPMVEYQMRKMLNFFNSADEVWIPQGAVEETIREYGYRGRVRVVENGNDFGEGIEDVPAFRREARKALGIPEGRLQLIFVGQHILEKGVDVILRALALLRDIDFGMDFVGTGYAVPEMEALIAEHNLGDRVRLHGVVADRQELRQLYASADLFLFPSFYDNAPLVVREAAAMHTPSVLLEGSTAAEMVRDGSNGFLTRRTPEAYAETITALAADRRAIRNAGIQARATLCRPWRDIIGEVRGLYDEIIARHHDRKRD